MNSLLGVVRFAAQGLILTKLLAPSTAFALPYDDPAAIGSNVTMSAYNKIHDGMPLTQVRQLLGGSGSEGSRSDVMGETFTMYVWYNRGRSGGIIVQFDNDRVISKTEQGLQ